MTKVIWKFPFNMVGSQVVYMPVGSKILTCQIQNGGPCLWALVDPAAPKEARVVCVMGTGHVFSYKEEEYVGSVQEAGGALVWHMFVEKGKEEQ